MPDENGNLLPGEEGYVAPEEQPKEELQPTPEEPQREPQEQTEDDTIKGEPVVLGNETEPFTDHAETIDGHHAGHNPFYHGSAEVNPNNPLATVSDKDWAADVNRENR